MNWVIIVFSVVVIVSSEVESRHVITNGTVVDRTEFDSEFIKQQCFYYGLAVSDVESAQLVSKG